MNSKKAKKLRRAAELLSVSQPNTAYFGKSHDKKPTPVFQFPSKRSAALSHRMPVSLPQSKHKDVYLGQLPFYPTSAGQITVRLIPECTRAIYQQLKAGV